MEPSLSPNQSALASLLERHRNLFIPALKDVLAQMYPSLKATQQAFEYLDKLMWQICYTLCVQSPPRTWQEVEDRVIRSLPCVLGKRAQEDARKALEKRRPLKGPLLVFPVDKLHNLLQKEIVFGKVNYQICVYVAAVLETIASDILALVGKYVSHIRLTEISTTEIKTAMFAKKELMDFFQNQTPDQIVIPSETESYCLLESAMTYKELVDDLIAHEKEYLRTLRLLLKVFRAQLESAVSNSQLDPIFSNLKDLDDVTRMLLSCLEDCIEAADGKEHPLGVGICFVEFAEGEEFDVYDPFIDEVLCRGSNREKLELLLEQADVASLLQRSGQNFLETFRYLVPKLLLVPVHHFLQYFDYINALLKLVQNDEDQGSLEDVKGLLQPKKVKIERALSHLPNSPHQRVFCEFSLCQSNTRRTFKEATTKKFQELQISVEGWDTKELGDLFILEGLVFKVGKRASEKKRYAFLFDRALVLCKYSTRRTSVAAVGSSPSGEYRVHEKFFIKDLDVQDFQDAEDLRNAFQLVPRTVLDSSQETKSHLDFKLLEQPMTLFCKNVEEKREWMAHLLMLTQKTNFNRILDSIMLTEANAHPLVLPNPDGYPFSEPDTPDNLILEDSASKGAPSVIRGATLRKLVERLTYHLWADTNLIRTFLTTYRGFCSPTELLNLLKSRFDIPVPEALSAGNEEELREKKEVQKRTRVEYIQPVQFRVLNVIRHWVDGHFYDFDKDPHLLEDLVSWLDSIHVRILSKWLDSIRKTIRKRRQPERNDVKKEITFGRDQTPPDIEWHIQNLTFQDFGLLTLHPVELARQLTLVEFSLFSAVRPAELVGSAWTKKDKMQSAPNLLKFTKHTDRVTRWLQKWIVEMENLEERLAVLQRVIEIMVVLGDLNNFNGVLECMSAVDSAAIHRLNFSLSLLPAMHKKALQEARDLSKDHFKKYREKLRTVNPPCIPFMGMYMTSIVHIDDGNQDYIKEDLGLINFSKFRKVAEITGEVQQHQNQPYCLHMEDTIRTFLEELNPFPDLTVQEIDNYLYQKSLEIEPRDVDKPPKFPRKFPHISLKSPGIKTKSLESSRSNIPTPLLLTEGLRRPKNASGGQGSSQQQLMGASSSTPGGTTNEGASLEDSASPPTSASPNTISPLNELFHGMDISSPSPSPLMASGPPPLPPRPPRGSSHNTPDSADPCRPPARPPPRSAEGPESPPPLPPRDRGSAGGSRMSGRLSASATAPVAFVWDIPPVHLTPTSNLISFDSPLSGVPPGIPSLPPRRKPHSPTSPSPSSPFGS